MQTKYILRIEHPETGLGPYMHNAGQVMPDDSPNPAPCIFDDVIEYHQFDFGWHVCGVEYMSQLYEWFGPNLQYLYNCGFRLYMYLLPLHLVLEAESKLQVAFNKMDALEVTQLA